MNACIRWSIILLMATLAGCSSGPRRGAPAPVISGGSAATLPDYGELAAPGASPRFTPPSDATATAASPVTSPAVVALLAGAEKKHARGDLGAAAAEIERALRIEPRNARLWHRLALIRFDQRRYPEAIELATRSSSLAQGDSRLKAANRALIERARAGVKRG